MVRLAENARRTARRGMTMVEMLFVMILMSIVMVLFYMIFSGTSIRAIGVAKRADGQETVRILLARMRQELKSAIALVDVTNNGARITIPLEDKRLKEDDPAQRYYSEYEYNPQAKEIQYRKLNRERGGPLESRLWLGGKTQVLYFNCQPTGENERILFQYYKVVIQIDTFDVKLRPNKTQAELEAEGEPVTDPTKIDPHEVIHSSTTVYPRRINMELRIEVPQEGGTIDLGMQ